MAGKEYLQMLKLRRKEELEALKFLTGKGYEDWDLLSSADEEKNIPSQDSYVSLAAEETNTARSSAQGKRNAILLATVGVMGLLSVTRRKKISRKN
jgi:hypothetical protein